MQKWGEKEIAVYIRGPWNIIISILQGGAQKYEQYNGIDAMEGIKWCDEQGIWTAVEDNKFGNTTYEAKPMFFL